MIATPLGRQDLRSLRLYRPALCGSSRLEVTTVGALTVAATGLWLVALPLELLAFIGS